MSLRSSAPSISCSAKWTGSIEGSAIQGAGLPLSARHSGAGHPTVYDRDRRVGRHSPSARRAQMHSAVARLSQPSRSLGMWTRIRRMPWFKLLKGLGITFRQQHPANICTEQYPLTRPPVSERYRGAPRLNIHPETGETLCIACDLCAVACPENLIVVGSKRDPKTKHKVLTTFTYDLSRCMFCGLCEDACPLDAIELTQDFELASFTRKGLIWDRQMLEQGPVPEAFKH
jgi:NADH-quinone oxidoreductase subunit I